MKLALNSQDKCSFIRKAFYFNCLLFVVGCWYCLFLRDELSAGVSFFRPSRKPSLILLWTTFFGSADFHFGLGRQPFLDHGCEVDNCYVTTDREHVSDSEAVVFHIRDLNTSDLPDPKFRKPEQRYVFFLQESPLYTDASGKTHLNGFFNWTMTYRLDSDVLAPYGRVTPSTVNRQNVNNYSTSFVKNRKLVAWLVSNCKSQSGREDYVVSLSTHIRVEMFGACAKRPCDEECERDLFQNYKFYLSFENSLCRDYVTEKLFKVLGHDVVPVVLGMANYSALLPPRSYIDTAHFRSPRKLADHLLQLDANDTAYREYLRWKDGHRVDNGNSFCQLCKRLQEDGGERKVYENIWKWWFNGNESSEHPVCRKPETNQQSAFRSLWNRVFSQYAEAEVS